MVSGDEPHEFRCVFTGNREPGEAAGQLARRHDQDRHKHDTRHAVAEISSKKQRRRHEIEDLHQRLRHQPGVAQQ